jgi:hypothetical protein
MDIFAGNFQLKKRRKGDVQHAVSNGVTRTNVRHSAILRTRAMSTWHAASGILACIAKPKQI